jgi:hypothetical protein
MNAYHAHADPPRTLAERLAQLNDNLQALGERLKASIAGVVGDAVADAVRDSVHSLLGGKEAPAHPYGDRPASNRCREHPDSKVDDPWSEEDRRWADEDEEVYAPARERPSAGNVAGRWHDALNAALQISLYFLKQQPRRRPVLTTVCVSVAAGVTAFVAGPVLAAGAGVLASLAGLILTAAASQTAAELASG